MKDNDKSSRLFYHGTDCEMRLGDLVEIRRWFRSPLQGVVCYIPGISPLHSAIQDDCWGIRLGDGTVLVTCYCPDEAQPGKEIRFLSRGLQQSISPNEELS
jgi:hypothetical protein